MVRRAGSPSIPSRIFARSAVRTLSPNVCNTKAQCTRRPSNRQTVRISRPVPFWRSLLRPCRISPIGLDLLKVPQRPHAPPRGGGMGRTFAIGNRIGQSRQPPWAASRRPICPAPAPATRQQVGQPTIPHLPGRPWLPRSVATARGQPGSVRRLHRWHTVLYRL